MFTLARQYNLSVTVAHQVTASIPQKLVSILVGTVGTIACMQLAGEDAAYFQRELQLKDWQGKSHPEWLQNLDRGEIYFRTRQQKEAVLIRTAPDL